MKYNDFDTDLQYSLEGREDELFNDFYARVLPNVKEVRTVEDMELQRKGIDKQILLHSGKVVLIDEKKRRKDYGDILLEEYANWEAKRVGWLGRDKHTDYIVYAFMDTRRVYLLPFLLLQKAWLKNYHKWVKSYGRKFAKNKWYRTSNIPIPTKELLTAIEAAGRESFPVKG